MKNIASNLKSAALISFVIVLPFAILNFLFNPWRTQDLFDTIALFTVLWLVPMAFIVIFAPLVQSFRAGNNILKNPSGLLLRVAVLGFLGLTWGWAISDQFSCFIAVPNCD